mgnify:CR=1 FL=1
MKNKAFTLVELLAVIAIIGITSTFVLINTNNKKEEYSKISNDEIKEIIRVSTHSYIVSSEEISNKVKSSTSGYEIEKGYISDEKLKNFETNKDINTKNVTIIVTYGLNDEGTAYEYQYQINGIK